MDFQLAGVRALVCGSVFHAHSVELLDVPSRGVLGSSTVPDEVGTRDPRWGRDVFSLLLDLCAHGQARSVTFVGEGKKGDPHPLLGERTVSDQGWCRIENHHTHATIAYDE